MAQGGFVGDSGCGVEIASAQPIKVVLFFLTIAATPRNDVAFDGSFRVGVVPSIVVLYIEDFYSECAEKPGGTKYPFTVNSVEKQVLKIFHFTSKINSFKDFSRCLF